MPHSQTSRLTLYIAVAFLTATAAWPQPGVAQSDTVRVGSVALRAVTPGVDTIEIYKVENGARTLSRVNVIRRTSEQYQGRNVLRIVAEDGRMRTDARLDPGTLQLIRFDRTAAMDSTSFSLQNNCFTGWTDFPNQPRKVIQCVPAVDRFGSGALNATVLSALPLRSGWDVRIATFDEFGDITSYPIRVARMDTARVGNREYAAWRVERTQRGEANISASGATATIEVKTTWWVDTQKARVLQERQTVTIQGTTQETLRVLRNP